MTSATDIFALLHHREAGAAKQAPTATQVNINVSNVQINLRKIPLLAGLTEKEMAKVKASLRIKRFVRRETVIQKGGNSNSLLFLLSGQLQVIDTTEDGRTIGLRILSEGNFFGEISIINSSKHSASVVALSEVLVAFLPSATALSLFSNSLLVANYMLRHMALQIQRDSEFRALLSIPNVSKRIYTFLDLIKEKKPGTPGIVENLPTHHDIAIMINTSRETVTRALLALAQQGIIQKKMRQLIIRDPEALQKLAQGST